jgi:hypothetical protein
VTSSFSTADAPPVAQQLINSMADIYVNMMTENHDPGIYCLLVNAENKHQYILFSVYAMSGPSI